MRSLSIPPAGRWRHVLLLAVVAGSFAVLMLHTPVAQDPAYHHFADQRDLFSISRFFDVVTNLPFLIVGTAGLLLGFRRGMAEAHRSWTVFFAGVALIGIGSVYYHADPTDRTLIGDRLPMTAGFMGVLVAVLAERICGRIETYALLPAVVAGLLSVLWWSLTGDLRPYIWVQLLPMIVIPIALLLYPGCRTDNQLIMLSLLCYVLAKVAEHYDHAFYAATRQAISGHSLKHLLAAAGCAILLVMIRRRVPEELLPGDGQRTIAFGDGAAGSIPDTPDVKPGPI